MTGLDTSPWHVTADSPALGHILDLIRASFQYMHSRINPPSSVHRLSVESMRVHCRTGGEIWAILDPPAACMFLTPKADCLYLGKLAVRADLQGRGIGRALVHHAECRALALGLPMLELETRVELTENHRTFMRLGFTIAGMGMHDGFDRPTDVRMRKILSSSADSR